MSSRAVSLVDLVLHELRTPLTVATGSLRQVADLPDPVQRAAVARALRSCERLEQLASQMRDWTRIEDTPGEPGAMPLASGLAEAVAAAAAGRASGVTVVAGDHHGVVVRALPHLLPNALAALLSAVARAADADEAITIEVRVADHAATVVARRPQAGSWDKGETFAAEWLGGLGFSLPLARAVIAGGGGEVTSTHAPDGRLQAISVRLAVAGWQPSR